MKNKIKAKKYQTRESICEIIYPDQIGEKSIVRHFWSFYALEFMLFNTKNDNLGFLKEKQIIKLLEETTDVILSHQIMALEYCIRSELRHFFNSCKGNVNWPCRTTAFLKKCYSSSSELKLPIEEAISVFEKDIWYPQYGGKKWAKACKFFINAKKEIESMSLKKKIIMVDRIFDMQHNCGFILNKTNFSVLEKHFDNRNKISNIKDLLRHSSSYIYNDVMKILKN